MGSAEVREIPMGAFPDYLVRTLVHQVGSGLLMLVLMGVLWLLLGQGA